SASMGAVDQDQPLFENARRLAREVLDQSRPGDAVNLVRLSALPPRVIVQTPSFNATSVRDEVDRLELSATPAAVAAALEETLPLLQAVPEITRKQVYFISDFQRASWEPDRGAGDG
ncbi:MAG: vWA domain-containing protein, partial [Planctomycetaceae bacterium]